MSTMWRYRDEAIEHVWEFLDLASPREKSLLRANFSSNPERIELFISSNEDLVFELVRSPSAQRQALLRRMSNGDPLTQMALILGSWRHCRKAVLAYDWLRENESRLSRIAPGEGYRDATVRHGVLYGTLKLGPITRWPSQWGKTPFLGEGNGRYPTMSPDYVAMIDNYNPATGVY